MPPLPSQAVSNLTSSLSARNISVVVSEGEALHIDQINATETTDVAGAAAKIYLDWYMLTQARCGCRCVRLTNEANRACLAATGSSLIHARSWQEQPMRASIRLKWSQVRLAKERQAKKQRW